MYQQPSQEVISKRLPDDHESALVEERTLSTMRGRSAASSPVPSHLKTSDDESQPLALQFKPLTSSCDAILSPTRRLPLEILGEIFLSATNHIPGQWKVITQVCRHWREVSRSLPQYWSHFSIRFDDATSFNEAMNQFSDHAQRSKQHSLHISVRTKARKRPATGAFHLFLNTILSDANIAKHVSFLSMESKGIQHTYHYDPFSLPRLRTLLVHDGPPLDDFEIDFSDEHLTRYEARSHRRRATATSDDAAIYPDWMISFFPAFKTSQDPDRTDPEVHSSHPQLRMVSLGQAAYKSIYNGLENPAWSQLTHVFIQPVLSEDGWWDVMHQCESLVMGWFNVTQQWEEHDSCDPCTSGSSNVQDLTVAFVDYGEPSQHCLETLSDSSFPSLRTLALHVNEIWDTWCGPIPIQDSMPQIEKICLPRSWSMRGRHWNFLQSFTHLRHLELGIRISRLNRSLKALTLSVPANVKKGSTIRSPAPQQRVKDVVDGHVDGHVGNADEIDEEEEEEGGESEEEEEGEEESDSTNDSDGYLRCGPPRQPFLPYLERLTLEISDLCPPLHPGRPLSDRHIEPFVTMVQSRTEFNVYSPIGAFPLRSLEISMMQLESKRAWSSKHLWSDGEASSKGDETENAFRATRSAGGDKEGELDDENDSIPLISSAADPFVYVKAKTMATLDILRNRLLPFVEQRGLYLDLGFRDSARSSYSSKWAQAQSPL